MPVSDWSTTPADNDEAPPNGAPEGWAPSQVNNTIRQIMADVRVFYDNAPVKDAANTFTQAASVPDTYALRLSSSDPFIAFNETGVTTDNGKWDVGCGGETFLFRALTDAGVPTTWLQVDRSAGSIDSINLQAALTITTGDAKLTGAQFLTGAITPAALASGSTNDYAPTGFATARVLRLTPNAAGSTLTGLAGGAAGRVVTLINIGGPLISLADESASSAAANRFATPVSISSTQCCTCWYDGDSSRWRVFF